MIFKQTSIIPLIIKKTIFKNSDTIKTALLIIKETRRIETTKINNISQFLIISPVKFLALNSSPFGQEKKCFNQFIIKVNEIIFLIFYNDDKAIFTP